MHAHLTIMPAVQVEVDDSILRRVPITRFGAACAGNEDRLVECPLPGFECGHDDDVLLTCFSGPSDRANPIGF